MKLSSKQVNTLKVEIEGSSLENLYNRLKWDTPKTIRLSLEEKDTLELMYKECYLSDEGKELFKILIKERLETQ